MERKTATRVNSSERKKPVASPSFTSKQQLWTICQLLILPLY
ncbi:hypothetical protein T01_3739 [Trichinella spiralis]|uniref:Uncharacterized protein n=1 Tax=Trichinella spiralis TaxID=6334 RepID=A0A0V0Z0X1_TRISP|nr:hypothetical protein T01_3739 [Trichinella spiralis]